MRTHPCHRTQPAGQRCIRDAKHPGRCIPNDGPFTELTRVPLAPLATRLERAAVLLDDGWGFEHVRQVLRLHQRTLRKRFPGRAWTHRQTLEAAWMARRLSQIPGRLA
jgi:hypothetical protein